MNPTLLGLPARAWLLPLIMPMVAGWLAWQSGPDLPSTKTLRFPDEQWSLAKIPVQDLKKAEDYLATASIWGNVAAAKEEDERDPAWRFLAIMANGNEKYVLISVEKQPNRQLKIGDQLPGGAKIDAIRDGSLCVVVNGKKRILPIYPQDRQLL